MLALMEHRRRGIMGIPEVGALRGHYSKKGH
jgi:hypothetical protein